MIAYPCALCPPVNTVSLYAHTVIDGVPLCAQHARQAATTKLGLGPEIGTAHTLELRERAGEWITGFMATTDVDRVNSVGLLLAAADRAHTCVMEHSAHGE